MPGVAHSRTKFFFSQRFSTEWLLKTNVFLWKPIEYFTSPPEKLEKTTMTNHFEFVENHITIVTPSFSKNPGLRFFRPHWNARLTFSMSSVWGAFSKTSVFVTLKVKTAGMTVELKLRFQISLAKSMNLKVKVLCFYCGYRVFSFGSLTKYFFIILFRPCLISTPSQKKAV